MRVTQAHIQNTLIRAMAIRLYIAVLQATIFNISVKMFVVLYSFILYIKYYHN